MNKYLFIPPMLVRGEVIEVVDESDLPMRDNHALSDLAMTGIAGDFVRIEKEPEGPTGAGYQPSFYTYIKLGKEFK